MPVNNGCTMVTGEKKNGEKSPDETVFHTWFYTTYVNEAWMVLSASSPFIDRFEAIICPRQVRQQYAWFSLEVLYDGYRHPNALGRKDR